MKSYISETKAGQENDNIKWNGGEKPDYAKPKQAPPMKGSLQNAQPVPIRTL